MSQIKFNNPNKEFIYTGTAFPETFKTGDRVLVNKEGHEFRGRVFMVEGDEAQVTDQEDYTAAYDISQLSHIED